MSILNWDEIEIINVIRKAQNFQKDISFHPSTKLDSSQESDPSQQNQRQQSDSKSFPKSLNATVSKSKCLPIDFKFFSGILKKKVFINVVK